MRRAILGCCALWLSLVLGAQASANQAVLVEFTSANCGPCQQMQPVMRQLTAAGVPVRSVDVDREPELARRYGVRQTPTFLVVSAGKERARLIGAHSAEQLVAAMQNQPPGPWVDTAATASEQPQTRLAPLATSGTPNGMGGAIALNAPVAASPEHAAPAVPDYAAPAADGREAPEVEAIRRALAATVRLRVHDHTGHGVGTGTVIDVHGEEALVLTCGHLFRDTQGQGRIEVDVFENGQPRTVAGQLIDYDADNRDIALVAIRPGIAIRPVPVIRQGQLPAVGTGVFSFGCDRGALPSRRDTRVTAVNKYNQHKGASNLEIAGAPIDGRSGGGLFDQNGVLVGVCNSADYNGDIGIYAGPGAVHWQLDRVQLARLYQGPLNDGPNNAPAAMLSQAAPAAPAVAVANVASAADFPAAADFGAPGDFGAGANDQEVIVIIRDRNNPQATPRVVTLAQPSGELLQMLSGQATAAPTIASR